jgi:osmotically-inducible protein OsmY
VKHYQTILAFCASLTMLVSINGCIPAVIGTAATTGMITAQDRSAGDAVDDAIIATKIKHLYLNKNAQDLLAGASVEVIEGRVHLTGKVETPETRIDAVRLAWQPDGVKEVINEIQIQKTSNLKDIAKDEWISLQLDTRITLEKNVRSFNYSTDVVNGIVYIMGISQGKEELDKVVEIASKIKGVKKVVTHVRIKEPGEGNSKREWGVEE